MNIISKTCLKENSFLIVNSYDITISNGFRSNAFAYDLMIWMFLYISINCCVLTFTEIPCPLGIASFITSTCQLVTICTHFAVSFTTHTLSIWYILPICTNWKYNKPDLWYAFKLMEKSISLCHLKSVIVLFLIHQNIRYIRIFEKQNQFDWDVRNMKS